MTEPATIAFGVKELAITIVGGAAAILGYNAKTVVNRLNKLEDAHVKKEDFNKTIDSLRRDIKEGLEAGRKSTENAHDKQTNELRTFYRDMTIRMDNIVKSKDK